MVLLRPSIERIFIVGVPRPFRFFGGRPLRGHRRSSNSIPPLFREQEADTEAVLPLSWGRGFRKISGERIVIAVVFTPNRGGSYGTDSETRRCPVVRAPAQSRAIRCSRGSGYESRPVRRGK